MFFLSISFKILKKKKYFFFVLHIYTSLFQQMEVRSGRRAFSSVELFPETKFFFIYTRTVWSGSSKFKTGWDETIYGIRICSRNVGKWQKFAVTSGWVSKSGGSRRNVDDVRWKSGSAEFRHRRLTREIVSPSLRRTEIGNATTSLRRAEEVELRHSGGGQQLGKLRATRSTTPSNCRKTSYLIIVN